ncbi:hypothetical protein CLOP_g13439 [Closterium sp. NIES-67]|nr:hypothetical protein CLOP_g13439 [Closterium sp. NIES-67]
MLKRILHDALLFLFSRGSGFSEKCVPSSDSLHIATPKSRQPASLTDRSATSHAGPSLSPPRSRIPQVTPRFAGIRSTSSFVSRASARRAFLSLLLLLVATAVLRSFCITWRCAHGGRTSRSSAFGGGTAGGDGIAEFGDSVATGERPVLDLRRNSRLWNIVMRSHGEPSDQTALDDAHLESESTRESTGESLTPNSWPLGEPRLFVPLLASSPPLSSSAASLSLPTTTTDSTATIPLPAPREHLTATASASASASRTGRHVLPRPQTWRPWTHSAQAAAAAGGAAPDRLSSAVAGATGELRRLLGGVRGGGAGSASSERGIPHIQLRTGLPSDDFRADAATFQRMGACKTALVAAVLERARDVLLSDTDVAWLRDPHGELYHGAMRHADVMVSSDSLSHANDEASLRADPLADSDEEDGWFSRATPRGKEVFGNAYEHALNTGVLLLRACPVTLDLALAWHHAMRTKGASEGWESLWGDQHAFNLLLRYQMFPIRVVTAPLQLPSSTTTTGTTGTTSGATGGGTSQQQGHTTVTNGASQHGMPTLGGPVDELSGRSVASNRVIWAFNARLRVAILPLALVPNGHVFFVQQLHRQHGQDGQHGQQQQPVSQQQQQQQQQEQEQWQQQQQQQHMRLPPPLAVHNTFQFHHALGKAARFREAGLWAVDPPEYYSDGNYVSMEYSTPPSIEAMEPGMLRHQAAIQHFYHVARKAFALAWLLSRKLILPRVTCFCDRWWDSLTHPCRAPGSDRDPPFACPIDYLISPLYWGGNATDMVYRPAGFLEDPRTSAEIKASRWTVRVH